MFNFNEEDLVKASASKDFNGGKAGRVENVIVKMEKLGVEYQSDSPKAPKYRIIFEDGSGAKINKACFSIEPADYPNQWGKTYEETVKKEWAYLAKIAEHSGGVKPMNFTDAGDLFEKMYQAGAGLDPINIFVNYGSTSAPKERLEIRKWLPAVELVGTSAEDTKLRAGSLDQMTFLSPDEDDDDEDALF